VRFSVVVAGDGPDHAALVALADRLGLADRVHFLGPVAAVHSLYPQLDLVVIPSRSEGLPNVLLEAMGARVPVVATRVGAVTEVLDGEPEAGRTVAPEDPAALADAMGAAWSARAGASAAARAAADAACVRVADRFSLERRIARLRAVYEAVAGRPA
jgi:glycosyltransferase involved in cell wall biosynthesis